jgi:hypothetical protein
VHAEEHRQLGAHQHGHGRLNVAIEDNRVSMELEAPGADIAGFEHAPATEAEKAALDKAKAKLSDGMSLFLLPSAAGCRLTGSTISMESDYGGEARDTRGAHDHQAHSDFVAEYTMECTAISRLTSITFEYFKVFPGAQELDISLITPKGQTSYEVGRDKPRIDLTGIM